MIIVRLLAAVSLLVALVAGIHDAMLSATTEKLVITPLGKAWFDIHAASLNLVQALIERYASPTIWDPGIITLLQWPAWAVMAGLGIVLLFFARILRR